MTNPNQVRALQNEEGGVASGIIFFGALAACFLWCCGPSILGCLKRCCLRLPGRRRQQSQERQQELENAIDSMIRSADDADRARSALFEIMGGSLGHGGNLEAMQEENRKAYISRALVTKVYSASEGLPTATRKESETTNSETAEPDIPIAGATTTSQSSSQEEKEPEDSKDETVTSDALETAAETKEDIETGNSVDVAEADESEGCIICLNPYEDGEEIAWSLNEQCPHVFHKSCIEEWLMKREDCPICRNYFMRFDDVAASTALHPLGFSAREFLGEDDSEHSIPLQLLRGLEVLYRARALSEARLPAYGASLATQQNTEQNETMQTNSNLAPTVEVTPVSGEEGDEEEPMGARQNEAGGPTEPNDAPENTVEELPDLQTGRGDTERDAESDRQSPGGGEIEGGSL